MNELLVPDILSAGTAEVLISSARGDSIHPSILLLTALASGSLDRSGIVQAAACELFHLATWTHDAVVDGVPMDGWPQEWMIVNGDHIFSRALTLLASADQSESEIASRMLEKMAQGEIEYVREGYDSYPERHIQMISHKYGSLFSASVELGSLAARPDRTGVEALQEFGKSLGVAYKLGDEILRFGDLERRGRMTLPVLYALKNSGNRGEMPETQEVSSLKEWCTARKGMENTRKEVAAYSRKASAALAMSGAESEPLEELISWVAGRVGQ